MRAEGAPGAARSAVRPVLEPQLTTDALGLMLAVCGGRCAAPEERRFFGISTTRLQRRHRLSLRTGGAPTPLGLRLWLAPLVNFFESHECARQELP